MEQINNEVKGLFRANYLNQPVLRFDGRPGETFKVLCYDCGENLTDKGYLLLRDISQLTDDEILLIAKIIGCKIPSFERYVNYLLIRDDDDQPYPLGRSGFTFKIWYSDQSLEVIINGRIGQILNQLSVFDYLRSIGIILPFTYLDNGKPITLSTDELLQLNWAKIKPTL